MSIARTDQRLKLRPLRRHSLLWLVLLLALSAFYRSARPSQKNDEEKLELFRSVVRDCEGAFVHKSAVSPRESRLQELFDRISVVFVLGRSLSECEGSVAKGSKYVCIIGRQLDSCLKQRWISQVSSGHGHLVSMSHAAMFSYAISRGFNSLVLLEADAVVAEISHENLSGLVRVLFESKDWKVFRFGYRPFFIEGMLTRNTLKENDTFADFSCPKQCECILHPSKSACLMKVEGCDMRSADFYAVHQRAYRHLLKLLLSEREDRIIDWTALQHVDQQWYTIPALSVQKQLDIPHEIQTGMQFYFQRACAA